MLQVQRNDNKLKDSGCFDSPLLKFDWFHSSLVYWEYFSQCISCSIWFPSVSLIAFGAGAEARTQEGGEWKRFTNFNCSGVCLRD